MTKNLVALLSALIVAGVCQAGGGAAKDKDAPTAFASDAGGALPPAPCAAPCASCRNDHACWAKFKNWICFVPLRTCPCECKYGSACYPPLYLYFLQPCVEGTPCWHADNRCASCISKNTVPPGEGLFGLKWFHTSCGCGSTCDSCNK